MTPRLHSGSILDPAVLASIRDLELVARVTVEGALSGLHRSPFHGYSAEFSQYRHYRAGDDLKYIDWKLFARTDRLYTKQYRETTNARVQIVLDASASMAYRPAAGISKFDYSRMLAAAIAHLVVGQADAVGVTIFDDSIRRHVGSRPGRSHLRNLLVTLANEAPAGRGDPSRALRRAVDMFRSRGVLFHVSDLYDDEETVYAELKRAVRMGHDVTVCHVLTSDELDWAWDDAEFEDSESGRRIASGPGIREAYRSQMQAFIDRWRGRCTSEGIAYVLARTDVPLAATVKA